MPDTPPQAENSLPAQKLYQARDEKDLKPEERNQILIEILAATHKDIPALQKASKEYYTWKEANPKASLTERDEHNATYRKALEPVQDAAQDVMLKHGLEFRAFGEVKGDEAYVGGPDGKGTMRIEHTDQQGRITVDEKDPTYMESNRRNRNYYMFNQIVGNIEHPQTTKPATTQPLQTPAGIQPQRQI